MGKIVITDEAGAPATPADGVALYSVESELRYVDESGAVQRIATDAKANIGAGAVTNAMLATDAKIGSLAALTTTAKTSMQAAVNELNAIITAALGGATILANTLREWASGEDYEVTAVNYDADGVVTTATVKWPDGSGGTFTTTTKNSTWLAVDAYTISHTISGKTVTQAAVTRDADGQITVKPALTVA